MKIHCAKPAGFRILKACIAVAMLATTSLLFVAAPAHADQPDYFGPTTNGCGPESGISQNLIPNSILGFDFTASCNQHDICWGAGLDHDFCNEQFAINLGAVCNGNPVCNAFRWLYVGAVNSDFLSGAAYVTAVQENLDRLIQGLSSCGSDDSCIQRVTSEAQLDFLTSQLQGCGGDTACEQETSQRFGGNPQSGPVDESAPTQEETAPVVDEPGPTDEQPTPEDQPTYEPPEDDSYDYGDYGDYYDSYDYGDY